MRLRPDGVLELGGVCADVGRALLDLVRNGAKDLAAETLWVRQLMANHVRKLVAAKEDRFLSALLETRRIFQPCALTVGEAYGFLKGVAGYEAAGLLVRTGRLWA